MKHFILNLILCPLFLFGQQFNDFETSWQLDIKIDTSLPNNIWQIGPPQKMLFDSAFSIPNAIITDNINKYSDNNYSTFQFRADMNTLWTYPFFVITWRQKLDLGFKMDGGWIEASYDTGTSWVNILMDTSYRPLLIGGAPIDTLADGIIAFTGIDTIWRNMMICWSNGTGNPKFPLHNVMDIRFVFRSDSLTTNQEGWVIDNINAYPTFIDYISEYQTDSKYNFDLYPNPTGKDFNIEMELDKDCRLSIDILDLNGQLLKRVTDGKESKGHKYYKASLEDLDTASKMLLVRCTVDKSHRTQKLILLK